MMRSLQARLMIAAFVVSLTVGGLSAWAAYRQALHEMAELFDAQLSRSADLLLHSNVFPRDREERGHHGHDHEPREGMHRYQIDDAYRLFYRDGDRWITAMQSDDGDGLPRPSSSVPEYADAVWDGIPWRVLQRCTPDGDRCAVLAQPLSLRRHTAMEVALHSLQPWAIGLPILLVVLLIAIHVSLRPLRRLAAELRHRDPDHLAPVELQSPPAELQPAVDALNDLLARVDEALTRERRFTSDAAHELRTPLAALQVQLQVAADSADAPVRQAALAKVRRGAERMGHLVDQLLQLARLDAGEGAAAFVHRDPTETVQSVCADLGGQAVAKGITLSLQAAPVPSVALADDLFRILFRNLLDNALRYTPAGGTVEIRVEAVDGQVRIVVADDGPGVPAEAIPQLGQRFHRLNPAGPEGVGLGLSIATRIAMLHGARLAFGAGLDGRGFGATILFPIPS